MSAEATTNERASILLVDDMEDNLIALEAVLGSLNEPLVRARSGEEAMKALLRQHFALVLLDVRMPGMDGFETAANIKRLDQTKDVPIILLTGTDADSDYAYRGYAIGAADFLTKPFDPWLLRTKVNVPQEPPARGADGTAGGPGRGAGAHGRGAAEVRRGVSDRPGLVPVRAPRP